MAVFSKPLSDLSACGLHIASAADVFVEEGFSDAPPTGGVILGDIREDISEDVFLFLSLACDMQLG